MYGLDTLECPKCEQKSKEHEWVVKDVSVSYFTYICPRCKKAVFFDEIVRIKHKEESHD